MDFIRMYYSNMDVMPKVLLNQFFRYMGFYVEEIVGNTKPSDKQSSFDIYVVGDEYWKEKGGSFVIDNIEKAIFIFAQTKHEMQDVEGVHIVRYSEGLYTFLKTLIVKMCDIYDSQISLEKDIVIFEKRRILVRAITDYIAGMTDGYALEEYEKLR